MGYGDDWDSLHQRNNEQFKEEVERATRVAQTMVWGIIIGSFVMFLLVVAISYYCYKKKRVTPGFVIRPPPDNVAPPNAAPGYPPGTVGYTPLAPGYSADAAAYPPGYPGGAPGYQPGAPGYQPGAPGYPTETPGYPAEKSAQPPDYNSGKFTQSHL